MLRNIFLRKRTAQVAAWFSALVLLALTIASMTDEGWVGYLASDDNAYIERAEEWLSGSPPAPRSHWATRHTLTLTIAASYYLFGSGETQVILPSLLFGCGLVGIVFVTVALQFGLATGFLSALLLATAPLTVELMTISNVDIIEAFFVTSSIIFFCISLWRTRNMHWLYLAGLSAGLAIQSRETSIALVLFYVAVLLFRPMIPRLHYGMIVLGCLTIVLSEMVYSYSLYDNPFLRYQIASSAASTVDPYQAGTGNISTGGSHLP